MSLSVNVDRYRREAEKCRRIAASAVERDVREQWAALAREYDALAGSADALSFKVGQTPEAGRATH